MTKAELKELIRECLREELAKANYLKESVDSREFVVTYRLKSWPASYKNTELLLDAEDEASAKEAFLDYMFDPDAYDEGDYMPSDENEIEIISIKASGKLAEGAFSGGVAGDNSFSGGTVRGLGASTQPDKKSYLNRLKSKNPDLVDTTTVKGKDIKPGMITQAGQVKTAEVKKNNRGEEKVYIMHTNDWDGFWDTDEDMLVMLDPDNKSKPFTGDYKELLKRGLRESRRSKGFYEEFKLYESMWDDNSRPTRQPKRMQLKEAATSTSGSFDPAELKACLDRVNANAADSSNSEIDKDYGSICVKLSEEDLKKALRIGSRGGYVSPDNGMTIPAQVVDMLSLEITRDDDMLCSVCLELYGENKKTGESTNEYNNDDVAFVGGITLPGDSLESDEEFIEYVKTEVFPNADRIAHDIINETWNSLGFNDYEGITDYDYDNGISGLDSVNDSDYDDDWSELLKQADSLLGDLVKASGNADYDDGDGYWQTEYDVWCFRYLYHFRMLNNVAKVEQLCKEYSKKLPNVEFYFSAPDVESGDDEVCEIGYTATRAQD